MRNDFHMILLHNKIAISYKNNIKSQPLKIVGKLVEKLHVERLHTSQLIWRAP